METCFANVESKASLYVTKLMMMLLSVLTPLTIYLE